MRPLAIFHRRLPVTVDNFYTSFISLYHLLTIVTRLESLAFLLQAIRENISDDAEGVTCK